MTQRRELSKQYKETGPRMGVYAIRNGADEVVFVGASLNVDGAMNRDRFELKNKTHRNKRLLEDWIRWGSDGLHFEVIDTVKKRDDPSFDPKIELASLLVLWREELDGDREGEVSTSEAVFTENP